jgi:osmotically-inducible protein OsmY
MRGVRFLHRLFTAVSLRDALVNEGQSAAPPSREGNPQMGETKDIRAAVEAELRFDPLAARAGITVRNMNGAVALNGAVQSYPQYLEAAAAAQRVGGAREVHNPLEVVLRPGDRRDDVMLTALVPDDGGVAGEHRGEHGAADTR